MDYIVIHIYIYIYIYIYIDISVCVCDVCVCMCGLSDCLWDMDWMDMFVPVHCQHGTPRICQHGVALWLENYGVILQHQQAEKWYFSSEAGDTIQRGRWGTHDDPSCPIDGLWMHTVCAGLGLRATCRSQMPQGNSWNGKSLTNGARFDHRRVASSNSSAHALFHLSASWSSWQYHRLPTVFPWCYVHPRNAKTWAHNPSRGQQAEQGHRH